MCVGGECGGQELCVDAVMVGSKCGLRMGLIGEQTRRRGQRGFGDVWDGDVKGKVCVVARGGG